MHLGWISDITTAIDIGEFYAQSDCIRSYRCYKANAILYMLIKMQVQFGTSEGWMVSLKTLSLVVTVLQKHVAMSAAFGCFK